MERGLAPEIGNACTSRTRPAGRRPILATPRGSPRCAAKASSSATSSRRKIPRISGAHKVP
jgi:hypothetical protein